jgi:hypothetical protein
VALKVVAMSTRVLVAAIAMLVAVPMAVRALMNTGMAGSWAWLPVCLLAVPGLAGVCALLLWWPHRRMRVVSVALTLVWATLVLSATYWPNALTRAELEAGIARIDYESRFPSETWGDSCLPWEMTWSCPTLTQSYRVDDGQAHEVVAAVKAAGYEPVGPRRSVPATDVGPVGVRIEGTAWEQDFQGHGLRMLVEVVTDREYVQKLSDSASMFLHAEGETVDISLYDDRCQTPTCGLFGDE